MPVPGRILVFQTAFTGDVILTLPMVQELRAVFPHAAIDIVVIPAAAPVLAHHPDIHAVVPYDKKGREKGLRPAYRLVRRLRQTGYDVAIIPHRSIRSAAICHLARIPRRIGFSTSAGKFLLTDVVGYEKGSHEVKRNLNLLHPLGIVAKEITLPRLYPSKDDAHAVDALSGVVDGSSSMVAVAPGSVWATKRWLPERYAELCGRLGEEGLTVVLVGGEGDLPIGDQIVSRIGRGKCINAMGKLTLLQSAELIGRCGVLVCNDSSPMHLAVAMRTPVVAIFGATVPEFGFAPLGKSDQVVQTDGLPCRPCSIHGGDKCPIGTFVCMKNIDEAQVLDKVHSVLSGAGVEAS